MPKTPLMMEFQITKEYLGFATHLAYLGAAVRGGAATPTPMRKGKGSTVAKVIDGSLHGYARTGMAGVANIGTDRNWTRLALRPGQLVRVRPPRLGSRRCRRETIAEEWVRMTFTQRSGVRRAGRRHDDGLARGGGGLHDAARPAPPDGDAAITTARGRGSTAARAPTGPPSTTTAPTRDGIGFDRTATRQQRGRAIRAAGGARSSAIVERVPEKFLLWFHHVPWDYRMQSGPHAVGRAGVSLHARRRRGQRHAQDLERGSRRSSMRSATRRSPRSSRSRRQEAQWWRDACIAYFQSFSKRPLPAGFAPPEHPLEYYKSLKFPYAPGIATGDRQGVR